MHAIEPTPLTEIHLPARAVADMAKWDVTKWIDGHSVDVKRQWWAEKLTANGLGDTLTGVTITRGNIFKLASAAATDQDAALTLLWNSLAWGSGNRNRNNAKRITSVAADPGGAARVLMKAAELATTVPKDAYELLYPQHRGAIPQLGPAFFTKYLYFAGGGAPDHPCAILDVNVARALNKTCGWESLPINGGWSSFSYDRYCTLLGNWVVENKGINRRDMIERWLFEEGKRLAPPRKRRGAR